LGLAGEAQSAVDAKFTTYPEDNGEGYVRIDVDYDKPLYEDSKTLTSDEMANFEFLREEFEIAAAHIAAAEEMAEAYER